MRERGRAHRRRAAAAVAVTVALAGCSGDDETASATTTVVPTTAAPTSVAPTTTTTVPPTTVTALAADPTLTPEQQVEAAYLHSWEVFADALATGDPSALSTVYAGETLETRSRFVQDLLSAGHRARLAVEHDYVIEVFDETSAAVIDRYVNRSVTFDAATGEPVEPAADEIVGQSHTMRLTDGIWKVHLVQEL